MTPTVEFERPPRATAPAAPPAFVFARRPRIAGSAALAVAALVAVALSSLAPAGRSGFMLACSLSAVPPMTAALVWATRVRAEGSPAYHRFWSCWIHACSLGLAASGVGLVSAAWTPLVPLNLLLLTAAAPFWFVAGREALANASGRLDPAVDLLDGVTAVLVLGVPALLLVADALLADAELVLAIPLALFLVTGPAGLYGAVLGLRRVPPGERAAHAIGLAVVATFCVSVALILARVAGAAVPLPVNVAAHVTNLACVAALPLWAHRETSGGLARLPVERQVRPGNPMPVLCAVVLPVLAVVVLGWRRDDTVAVVTLVAVLVAVVALNAVRQVRLTREAQRLAADLAHMAEERRRLLADMVRALDDDRRRIVSELHAQAVGSLSTLGTVVQTACVSLPASTAVAVRESIAQVQGDLSQRAEELRSLLVALRPLAAQPTDPGDPTDRSDQGAPAAAGVGGGPPGDALGPALRAYAADVCDALPPAARPQIVVEVDPRLDLDRRTATIAYRIAQEAVLDAVLHSGARSVTTRVVPDEATGGVTVVIADDGDGLGHGAVVGGGRLTALELFTELGHGELTIHAVPGTGTTVRSRLGVAAGDLAVPEGRHLRLV
jgi:signal transduction histidine kinase